MSYLSGKEGRDFLSKFNYGDILKNIPVEIPELSILTEHNLGDIIEILLPDAKKVNINTGEIKRFIEADALEWIDVVSDFKDKDYFNEGSMNFCREYTNSSSSYGFANKDYLVNTIKSFYGGLFDFSIEDNCGVKSHVVFQVWQGRKEEEYYYRNGHLNSRTKIVDRTNIKKLNGKLFCYKHISYKELLYNGQIRKEEEQYSGDYLKDCGIIDTLKQHLYIKDDEKCPLYDAGIGKGVDLTNYNYFDYPYELYYNKDNYNEPNKKIIGKLILNDGQPCYKLNETLWRKFDSKEAGEEHLKCDLEIYGKFNDERFKHKGDITYNQIYQDNLSDENYELLKNKLSDSKVSLYSREFLGIDKACDEKTNISKDKYEKLKKNQEMERICLIIESVFSLFLSIIFIIMAIIIKIRFRQNIEVLILACLLLYLLLLFICIICHSVFLGRIIYYDLSYECSDDITNEVTKKENENTKKFVLILD